ncbi:MAG: hypothetical protein M3Y26_06390 [Actinomycetota bacterium]|nr:hypothetical protein [Actinomycetota bacterium]
MTDQMTDQENPAEVVPQQDSSRDVAPRTGDDQIDAALDDLDRVHESDLDEQLAAGERVNEVLGQRLSDLGGG